MSPLKNAKAHGVRMWTTLRAWTVPQDGIRRYLYDIWQPLTILVLTASFAGTFFAIKDPYASTSDLFYCNADGTVQMLENLNGGYKPFWDPDLFFTINVPVGDNLSFTLAKLLDAVWDLGVGRGGQMLAAVITYRVLRRSLTLVMESCTITIPTVTSVCCQQIGVLSSWHLLADAFSTKSSRKFEGRRLSITGKRRIVMQLFACLYVLAFPTLASIMTGYRTGFTGLFDYHVGKVSQVKPLAEVENPRMFMSDGNRIGLPDSIGYMPPQVPFPGEPGISVNIRQFLLSSKLLEEPAGVLVDYYFTCLGIMAAAQAGQRRSPNDAQVKTLACAAHDCSCSIEWDFSHAYSSDPEYMLVNMTSNITIHGAHIELPAPPLDLRFAFDFALPLGNFQSRLSDLNRRNVTDGMDAGEFWSGESFIRSGLAIYHFDGVASVRGTFNGSTYTKDFVKDTGICIASEKYSWGFSSLLLLTFCTYTTLFATTLILLQAEVYHCSRSDRNHQAYSIYADVLTIAEALKSMLKHDSLDLLPSPKALEKTFSTREHGIRLNVSVLPQSREVEYVKQWREDVRLEDKTQSGTEGDVELQPIVPVPEDLESMLLTVEQAKAEGLVLID